MALAIEFISEAPRKRGADPQYFERDKFICDRFRDGALQRDIGKVLGITYQRVQQILWRHGLGFGRGGRTRRAAETAALLRSARSEMWQKRLGISLNEREAIMDKYGTKPFRRYTEWRNNWPLTNFQGYMAFAQWWQMWMESGKWGMNGRGKFGVGRRDFTQPFSPENCCIVDLCEQASRTRRFHRKAWA